MPVFMRASSKWPDTFLYLPQFLKDEEARSTIGAIADLSAIVITVISAGYGIRAYLRSKKSHDQH